MSSVGLWDEVAYLIEWIVCDIVRPPSGDLDHYIDDFFGVGPRDSLLCKLLYETMVGVCDYAGVPLHDPILKPDKIHGPSTRVVLLGNEYNTITMRMNISESRRKKVIASIDAILATKEVVPYSVFSKLSGHIHSACAVISQGRYNRSEICKALAVSEREGVVAISHPVTLELRWWKMAILASVLNPPPIIPHKWEDGNRLLVFTDASSEFGCGAFFQPDWLMTSWPRSFKSRFRKKMTFQEFLPILAAVTTWSNKFAGKHVKFMVDNMGTLGAWRRGRSKDRYANWVLRCIWLNAVNIGMTIDMEYIPSAANVEADALSRNELSRFRRVAPDARSDRTPVHKAFEALLSSDDWDLLHPTAIIPPIQT